MTRKIGRGIHRFARDNKGKVDFVPGIPIEQVHRREKRRRVVTEALKSTGMQAGMGTGSHLAGEP
jgi:hypothetical protein